MAGREPLSVEGRDLRLKYRKSGFVLDVPEVRAEAGSTLVFLGPSGSGKSTLLRVLGLLDRPDAGSVLLGGREVDRRDRSARLSMAAVFQRPYLFKGSVRANVAYGLDVQGVPRGERAQRVAAALERVGLGGYEERSALALSGGEAQRVSLARALVLEPRVLLLDEPLASLDPLLKRQLSSDFATILRDAGVTVLYVTHDQDEAIVVADRLAVMNQGSIVAEGSPDEIIGVAPNEWLADFLGVQTATEGVVTRSGDGLTEFAAGSSRIIASGDLPEGTRALFSVRPEDVLLFESDVELPLTSARNRVPVTVACLEPRGATMLATLESDGVKFASSVSRAAARDLGIKEGSKLLAVFKASAVGWRVIDDAQVPSSERRPIIEA